MPNPGTLYGEDNNIIINLNTVAETVVNRVVSRVSMRFFTRRLNSAKRLINLAKLVVNIFRTPLILRLVKR